MHGLNPLVQELSDRILAARRTQELTQEEVAFAAGVSTRTLHDIEHGRLRPRLDTMQRILSVLGMTLEITTRSTRRMSKDDGQSPRDSNDEDDDGIEPDGQRMSAERPATPRRPRAGTSR